MRIDFNCIRINACDFRSFLLWFIFAPLFDVIFALNEFHFDDRLLYENSVKITQNVAKIAAHSQTNLNNFADQIDDFRRSKSWSPSSSTEECFEAIVYSLKSGYHADWSTKLINSNSFAKTSIFSAFLSSQFTTFGDYQSCLSVQAQNLPINQNNQKTLSHSNSSSTSSIDNFEGQYCLLEFDTPKLGYYKNLHLKNVSIDNENFEYIHNLAQNFAATRNRLSFVFGICIPSICDVGGDDYCHGNTNTDNERQEFSKAITDFALKYYFGKHNQSEDFLFASPHIRYCQTKANRTQDRTRFPYRFSLSLLAVTIAISVFSTLLVASKRNTKFYPAILRNEAVCIALDCFYIPANVRRLLANEIAENSKRKSSKQFENAQSSSLESNHSHRDNSLIQNDIDLRFLRGIRVLLILIVVAVHVSGFLPIAFFSPVTPFANYPDYYHRFFARTKSFDSVFDKFFTSMGIFFTLTGMLATFVVVVQRFRDAAPSFAAYAGSRYVRCAPSIAMIIALTFVAQQHGTGPAWHRRLTAPHVDPCLRLWWTNLLLINNFWKIDESCSPAQWFIATNFQLYLALFPLLLVYYRRPKLAFALGVACSLAYLAIPILIAAKVTALFRYDFVFRFRFPPSYDSFRLVYTVPLLFTLPFFLGALNGFRLAAKIDKARKKVYGRFRRNRYSRNGNFSILTLLLVMFACLLEPFSGRLKAEENEQRGAGYMAAIFASYTIFSVAAAQIVYLLSTRRSCFRTAFESMPSVVMPLDRLSFGIYLSHPLIIWYNVLQTRDAITLHLFYILQSILSFYVQSILLASFLFVFVECPARELSKRFCDRTSRSTELPEQQQHCLQHKQQKLSQNQVSNI